MKSLKIIILISLIGINITAPDIQSNILTPLGHTVNAWITEEDTSSIRAATDNYYSQTRPNAIQIDTYDGYSSTRRFNCHGYAWYMSQKSSVLTNPRWIGYYSGNTDEHIYWNDGSYVEVTGETYPGMVSWISPTTILQLLLQLQANGNQNGVQVYLLYMIGMTIHMLQQL